MCGFETRAVFAENERQICFAKTCKIWSCKSLDFELICKHEKWAHEVYNLWRLPISDYCEKTKLVGYWRMRIPRRISDELWDI